MQHFTEEGEGDAQEEEERAGSARLQRGSAGRDVGTLESRRVDEGDRTGVRQGRRVAALRYTCSGSYGHGGAYRTFTWADPEKDMISILLYQRSNGGGDMADEINAFLQLAAAAIESGL